MTTMTKISSYIVFSYTIPLRQNSLPGYSFAPQAEQIFHFSVNTPVKAFLRVLFPSVLSPSVPSPTSSIVSSPSVPSEL